MDLFGLNLISVGRYYTFESLQNAPRHTIKGADLLGFTATATFEGEPWEVFKANGVVYDFTLDLVRPIASTAVKTTISQAGNRFTSPGLLLPGSLVNIERVQDFVGWFSRDRLSWVYSEVGYV
jgi:hypothetical protein